MELCFLTGSGASFRFCFCILFQFCSLLKIIRIVQLPAYKKNTFPFHKIIDEVFLKIYLKFLFGTYMVAFKIMICLFHTLQIIIYPIILKITIKFSAHPFSLISSSQKKYYFTFSEFFKILFCNKRLILFQIFRIQVFNLNIVK